MKVTIQYHDNDALTMEEVVQQAVSRYGKLAEITVAPESTLAYDYIYFGLQQLITREQLSLIFDKSSYYQEDIKVLRRDIINKVEEIVDQVIIDNESKAA